jgi:signal transduction histidine kinase
MPSSAGLWRRRLSRYLFVVAVWALALWCELALSRLSGRFIFVIFGPAVALSAWLGGRGPALVAVALSVIASDYFLLGSGELFTLDSAAEAAALAWFAAGWTCVALMAGAVANQIERERNARASAAQAASQAHRLSQTTAALGQARSSAEAIESIVQEALHWLGADAGAFFHFSSGDNQIAVARSVGFEFAEASSWTLDPLGKRSPFLESLQRLTPVVVRSPEDQRAEFSEWASQGPTRDYAVNLILPIAIERSVVAFLQVGFRSAREFTGDDHEYLFLLCSRSAQALSRTWTHEAVEQERIDAERLKERADAELRERQETEQALRASETRYRALATRTTRLHALTASLSEAASVTAVAQAIAEQAHIVVGASEGQLTLAEGDASPFEAGLCSAEALASRRPVFVGSLAESQERFWQSATLAADRGFNSTAALPLLVESTAIGVLEFHFTAPVNFDDEYRALLISVAQHCKQALDRARLYEQAQRARSDAEAANRLKDDFVSTVSHELRTPLNAILGWASMLRSGSLDADAVPQALESVYRNASRQAKLVDDLLDFSRMAGGRTNLDLEVVDIPGLMQGVVESLTPLAVSHQIDIALSALPEAKVLGDVRRLEQVFVNLLGNSLKFTPPGGHILVSARVAGREIEVRVADDGTGIAPEFLPHVFDRFRQGDSATTRNHSGLGLGLSIAKQLVEAHKGSIRVESAGPGKGTAIVVTLPLDSHTAEAPHRHAPEDAPSLDGVRVLVVDDEKDARDLIGRTLVERGATIDTAENARDAIVILERGGIDVLLADLAMADEDGYSLIKRIRSLPSDVASIPAAAVTAHARDDERRRALAAGFHRHVAKPVEPFALARMVHDLASARLVHASGHSAGVSIVGSRAST